jgi:ubiquinone/menaquinone biosynthesis C-methylase UbiE
MRESDYEPFPDETGRNWRQIHLEIPLMLLALKVPRAGRVLEVGCGRGVGLPPLSRRLTPNRMVGIDVDISLLAEARLRIAETCARVELGCADVRHLPFPDASFDVVIDFGTCFHVGRPAEALREIARVLAPGGVLVTETKLSQRLAHPVRSRGRYLPWAAVPEFTRRRHALLWQIHQR